MSNDSIISADAQASTRQVSRRDFLGGSLALGAAAGLGAPHFFAAPSTATDAAESEASVAGTINFLSWVAYDLH